MSGTGTVPDTDFGFTGKRLDSSTGLYYYGARYYDPELGRFTQPDSIVQAPSDPQTLNRYTYCRNNPLIYTDPTGHSFWKKVKSFFKENLKHIITAVVIVASIATLGAASAPLLLKVAAGFSLASTATSYLPGQTWSNISRGFGYAALAASAVHVGSQIATGVKDWAMGKGQLFDHLGHPIYADEAEALYGGRIVTNGILQSKETALALPKVSSGEAALFYNPSSGFIADITESILQKVTMTSSIDRQLAGIVRQMSGATHLIAHSQGALTVSNALLNIASRGGRLAEGSTVSVYGSAASPFRVGFAARTAGIPNTNIFYETNYFDPIAVVSPDPNPLKIATGALGVIPGRGRHGVAYYDIE